MRRLPWDFAGWLDAALKTLSGGGVVGVPTETVYGLAAGMGFPAGPERLCAIKRRPPEKAFPLQTATVEAAAAWGFALGEGPARLARVFWPGPLTLVLPRPPKCPPWFAPGHERLALRIPAHPVTLALLAAWGAPLAVTSANRTGEPECLDGASVASLFASEEDLLVIDAGVIPGGRPSTVVDAAGEEPVLLREGGIGMAHIVEVWHGG
jgi:L-threonylcarbamoyladenylate synthase